MSIKEKINQDFKDAFKAKEEARVSVLRMVNSNIKNKEFDKRAKLVKSGTAEADLEKASQLNDEEVLGVLGSEIKRRKDSIEQYIKGGRPELAAQEEAEIKILSAYMPEQMSEADIRKAVVDSIKEAGVSSVQDLGKVMRVLMPKVKGKADGNLVNRIVKEELSK